MRLINVKAFLRREKLIGRGKRVDRGTNVFKFCDDEATAYAILSHRWIEQEVNYDEMVRLEKMEKGEQDEVRGRLGYRKILDSCKQAEKDTYEWLWVDTCCINKESSAELSEAINSMYRWYENSKICYAYLHDVHDSSFPDEEDDKTYPKFNGWPEWFSRGWTLQEMIAPSNVQFFNRDWQPIGDKRKLAPTLTRITRVPQHILTDGLFGNRPCVAQIMSWAANRTTTRVEDRSYSLLGLLDVNMPMLYGEGKKAFHRLQLEIIRMSNDQSIFAWGGFFRENQRTGSILADDPSFFWDCNEMELIGHDEFIQELKDDIPGGDLPSIEEDRFGVFPITNRGIQIWMLLRPLKGSASVFEAMLPCRYYSDAPPVHIYLALWESNYYAYFGPWLGFFPAQGTLQFRQVYLKYQDIPHRDVTFEIDHSAVIEEGLIYCGSYPSENMGTTLTPTSVNPLSIKVYSNSQANCFLLVCIGQCFGHNWIHFVYEKSAITKKRYSWGDYAKEEYNKMLARGPEHIASKDRVPFLGELDGRIWVKHAGLPGSTWTVRTFGIVRERSKKCEVRIEVSQDPRLCNVSGEWRDLSNIEVGESFLCLQALSHGH
ncbi:heterokaryon incompatibility protein-domain-containing protein [Scleroderma yunnanense]